VAVFIIMALFTGSEHQAEVNNAERSTRVTPTGDTCGATGCFHRVIRRCPLEVYTYRYSTGGLPRGGGNYDYLILPTPSLRFRGSGGRSRRSRKSLRSKFSRFPCRAASSMASRCLRWNVSSAFSTSRLRAIR
jgi:hypothetical protein